MSRADRERVLPMQRYVAAPEVVADREGVLQRRVAPDVVAVPCAAAEQWRPLPGRHQCCPGRRTSANVQPPRGGARCSSRLVSPAVDASFLEAREFFLPATEASREPPTQSMYSDCASTRTPSMGGVIYKLTLSSTTRIRSFHFSPTAAGSQSSHGSRRLASPGACQGRGWRNAPTPSRA